MPKGQYRYWMVTTNDPHWKLELNDHIKFFVWQPEQPEGVGWHRQGYVEFHESISGKKVTQYLGQPVIKAGQKAGYFYRNEPAVCPTAGPCIAYCSSSWYCHLCHQGDHEGFTLSFDWGYSWDLAAHDECKKDGAKALKQKGKCGDTAFAGTLTPRGKGANARVNNPGKGKGDFQAQILSDIEAGMGRRELYTKYAQYAIQYHAWMDKMFGLFGPKRSWMPAVFWLWGSTGQHKSRLAGRVLPSDTYMKPDNEKWWYSYDRHGICVINDIDKGSFTWQYTKNLLDRYPFEVQNKGGQCQMVAKMFILTCSMPHQQMWAEKRGERNDDLDQLTRRLEGREYCLDNMSQDDKLRLLAKMRQVYSEIGPEEDDLYPDWDGKAPIPEAPALFKKYDDTEPPAKKAKQESK